ncbi:MAG: hypothetical protein WCF10_07010, partial [Polyangiales bacterium]
GATVAGNGTWNLPAASFGGPVTPNGVRVIAAVLQVALQCTMGVDAAGPNGTTPPVADLSSPTPSSILTKFNIQIP